MRPLEEIQIVVTDLEPDPNGQRVAALMQSVGHVSIAAFYHDSRRIRQGLLLLEPFQHLDAAVTDRVHHDGLHRICAPRQVLHEPPVPHVRLAVQTGSAHSVVKARDKTRPAHPCARRRSSRYVERSSPGALAETLSVHEGVDQLRDVRKLG